MHLFVDISSHGLGHLAISAPVLNALAKISPNLRLTVRSGIPPLKLHQRIKVPFDLIEAASDFGYVMIDATRINLAASADAYRLTHDNWLARVAAEADFLTRLKPDLVLTNVSYLPLAAAAQAGIPAFSLCSLNWADLFGHFFGEQPWAAKIHAEILAAYHSARGFLRVTPSMAMPDLGNLQPIGPIAALGQKRELGLRGEQAVLVALGGIAHRLPVENWPRLQGVRWLVPAEWNCQHPDALSIESFDFSFTDLLCSVAAVITKPGYGTFTEAACNGTPVIYQRREDWPEQDSLIEWLHANCACREVAAHILQTGQLAAELAQLSQQPSPQIPSASGSEQAARYLQAALLT